MRVAHYTKIASVLIAAALFVGCTSKTVVESDLGIEDAPDWVNEGTNVLKDRGGRLFHGVGSAPNVGDQSLQVSTADDRARSEVAKILSSYMDVASKDYIASSTSAGDTSVEASITRNIKNVTKINMTGVKIIGRWKDKKANTVYSLAELDMKYVQNNMGKIENMHPGFKDHIQNSGDKVFDSMLKGVN
ncbi:MAG: hypothetical protein OEZ47_05405 [Gammaproteobacteria bacterium]|nr:hypothetical protein [Gammaproteobacteria bacterium]